VRERHSGRHGEGDSTWAAGLSVREAEESRTGPSSPRTRFASPVRRGVGGSEPPATRNEDAFSLGGAVSSAAKAPRGVSARLERPRVREKPPRSSQLLDNVHA
jgi:hypothetical protein